eukprot:COSAG05_NODE_23268_length_259_cov_0.643750_2_plen_41_part_01
MALSDAILCVQVGQTGQNTGMLSSIGFNFDHPRWSKDNDLN